MKFVKYFLVFTVGMIVLTTGLFYLNRKAIKDKVIDIANSLQPGELKVQKIHLSPFSHFPKVSLRLQDVTYFERAEEIREEKERPICKINDFYLAFNISDLMVGNINVAEVTLDSAYFGLLQYQDSSLNIFNAVGFDPTDSTQTKEETKEVQRDKPLDIVLERLEINNLVLDFESEPKEKRAALRVDHFDTSFQLRDRRLYSKINTNMTLLGIKHKEKVMLKDKPISFKSHLKINQNNMFIEILEAHLSVFEAQFGIEGSYAVQQNGYADLKINAEKEDLSLLTFLTNGWVNTKGQKSEDNGKIYLNATIKGETKDTIPFIEANFGAKDVSLYGKENNIALENIGFKGYLSTGSKADLSEGVIKLEDLNVDSKSGKIRMSASVKNLKTPYLDFTTNSSFDLATLNPFLKGDKIKHLKGGIELKGSVKSTIDKKNNYYISDGGKVGLFLKDISFEIPQTAQKYEDINGILYLFENKLGIHDFKAKMNDSDIHFTGQAENILKHLAGQNANMKINAKLDSKMFHIDDFVKLDSTSQVDHGKIENLNIDLTLQTTSEKLNSYKLLPYGEFKINNLSAVLPGMSDLKKLKGRLEVAPEKIVIDGFEGNLGGSNINLSAELLNFESITSSDTEPLTLSYSINSNSMQVVDFFTFKNKLHVPQEYKNAALNGFKVNGKIDTSNKEIIKEQGFPFGEVTISKLEWRFNRTPLLFRDFNIKFIHKPNEMIIEDFTGKIGESDFTFNAHLENITDSTKHDLKGTFDVNAQMLNFNELLNANFVEASSSSGNPQAQTTSQQVSTTDTLTFNPFTAKYPSFDLKVNISHMKYAKMDITNFRGQIVTTPNRVIHFKDIGTDAAGGRLNFNGDLNLIDAENAVFKSKAEAKELDMNLIHFETTYEGETYSVADNFDGILNAQINSSLYLNPDLTVNLDKSVADIEASIRDGKIQNFGPLEAMSKYFSNKDLNNIRFAEIKNTLELKNAKVTIPKMDISSTIGQLYITGQQGLDMSMAYLVEVPVKLVRSVAWNTLTGRKKKSDSEDEIMTDEGGKYVAIRIVGDVEEYDVKLGKGKKVRQHQKEKKKEEKKSKKDKN
ncbi:AsmA-like protein [Sediminitomix flava]|uniref:AsmA-like protein n=2 Tax=Sediminitomix flava TaxID=379075 RepID=A0A315ZGB0_SEDFL|nr:AsmA-like protein [Sediminitomix flava]